ncbi:MAG: hypothetical protein COA43_00385 [Robiginitomaculum sp.]|nr:MAG: hypothetical protein COA43_00385 [Robiginitomaculum sp.]
MATTLNINPENRNSGSRPVALACEQYNNEAEMLLPILHQVQKTIGYIPAFAYSQIAKSLNLSRAEVYGVVSFYHDFRQKAPAKTIVKVCRSEACQSMGGRGLKAGVETVFSDNDAVAIEDIYCLGNCALAPAVMIGERVYGRASIDMIVKLAQGKVNV